MKKTFALTDPRLDPARVRDKIRQDLNRFSRQQHRKPKPEGTQIWLFDCKIGPSAAAAVSRPFKDLGRAVDEVAQTGATEVYIEIAARAGQR